MSTKNDSPPWEDTLSPEEVRRLLLHFKDLHYGMLYALRDLPQFPPPFVLMHLGAIGSISDWQRGKELQRELGLSVIPPKTECEIGAAVWERIRNRLQPKP